MKVSQFPVLVSKAAGGPPPPTVLLYHRDWIEAICAESPPVSWISVFWSNGMFVRDCNAHCYKRNNFACSLNIYWALSQNFKKHRRYIYIYDVNLGYAFPCCNVGLEHSKRPIYKIRWTVTKQRKLVKRTCEWGLFKLDAKSRSNLKLWLLEEISIYIYSL